MRRMDLHPLKKLRGRARHERSFFAAMDRLDGWFPEVAGDYWAMKLPSFGKALSPRHGSDEFRRAVVGRLIGAAESLSRAKPAGSAARVAALIDWPELWASEVCVFADADAAHGHAPETIATRTLPARTEWDGGWVEASAPQSDPLKWAGVAVPAGFATAGTRLREYDNETGHTSDREEWVVMEIAEGVSP